MDSNSKTYYSKEYRRILYYTTCDIRDKHEEQFNNKLLVTKFTTQTKKFIFERIVYYAEENKKLWD